MNALTEDDIKQMLDLRTRRVNLGFTLRDIEIKTGISNSYLSQLENKIITNPSFRVVVTLHNLYKSFELE
jgi:transcriptional regulator with XRE-family HTH domain